MNSPVFVVDAQTKDIEQRTIIFGDTYKYILTDYQKWIKENNISKDDIWYADVFLYENGKHIGYMEMDNGYIYLVGAPEDSKVVPFKHRMGIRRRLKKAGRHFSKCIKSLFLEDFPDFLE